MNNESCVQSQMLIEQWLQHLKLDRHLDLFLKQHKVHMEDIELFTDMYLSTSVRSSPLVFTDEYSPLIKLIKV